MPPRWRMLWNSSPAIGRYFPMVCRFTKTTQRGLSVRGGVDFDDLILLALQALESDDSLLARLQQRWPYVLEDEAQDSSALQEQMLTLLTAGHGNWVRVGDPNQAINTTFTSANPRFLREFVDSEAVNALPLPNSGRSAPPIIKLANQFIDWSRGGHPLLSQDRRFPFHTFCPPRKATRSPIRTRATRTCFSMTVHSHPRKRSRLWSPVCNAGCRTIPRRR